MCIVEWGRKDLVTETRLSTYFHYRGTFACMAWEGRDKLNQCRMKLVNDVLWNEMMKWMDEFRARTIAPWR